MPPSEPVYLMPGELPTALRAGVRKRIHIRGKAVAECARGNPQPCVVIRTREGDFICHECKWDGPSKLEEQIANPLPDGTRIWIETHAVIKVTR